MSDEDFEWGPWIDSHMPDVGMFIQVEAYNKYVEESDRRFVGVVLAIYEIFGEPTMNLAGAPIGEYGWKAKRWRERRLRDKDEIKGVYEEELLA